MNISVLRMIPAYKAFRAVGHPEMLPMNLTISPSFRCNSRCKTCNIYKKQCEEFTLGEWSRVFESLGNAPFWTTISGGEPFLNKDLHLFANMLYDICSPSIINIPTNGLLRDRISGVVKDMAVHCKNADIVINVSIDELGDLNDVIRGIPGSYDRAVETFKSLKGLALPNLSVGIHTVISVYNVGRIPDIYEGLHGLNPDSYITEIAEERNELDTMNSGITPAYGDYGIAVDYLAGRLRQDRFNRVGRLTRAFRIQYYKMVKRVLREKRQIIPCYAGFASAQIAPDGQVWMCCVKAEPVGNLRDVGYDFRKIWFSDKAAQARKAIRDKTCYCPLANAGYTNMLHDPKTLFQVGWNYLRSA
ncbi:radical SAM protein [Syntrophorhabdus aromaticivorans]|nr:radical SAM protein [Syntrophorhabdus aromaticivorans]